MIKDRRIALSFRIVSFFLAVAGILAAPGEFVGNVTWGILMYFTIQTNALAGILFAIFTARTARSMCENGPADDCGYYPCFTMISLASILMMGLSYWIILAPNSIIRKVWFNTPQLAAGSLISIWTFPNITTHGLTPLLLAMGYVLFTKCHLCLHKKEMRESASVFAGGEGRQSFP